jgi:serine/threonine-protein kinase
VRHQPVDRRADVFSLGVVLYELLTDQKPFQGSSLAEITTAVLEHEPPLANMLERDVPRTLAEIAARAMQKDPEHRFRSARSLSRELRHWLEENGQATNDGAEKSAGRSRLVWAAGLVGMLVLAIGGWWAWSLIPIVPTASAPPAAAAPVEAASAVAAMAAAAPALPASASLPDAVAPAPVYSGASASMAAAAVETPASAAAPVKRPRVATREVPRETPKETAKERRAREARERDAKRAAAPLTSGLVRIAVSPWGQVEVDGTPVGTAPPLNEVTLSEGRHQITIRNEDFPPYSAMVNVTSSQPVIIRHKFGS